MIITPYLVAPEHNNNSSNDAQEILENYRYSKLQDLIKNDDKWEAVAVKGVSLDSQWQ